MNNQSTIYLSNRQLEKLLYELFLALPERDRLVMKKRYGIDNQKISLSAIGRELKLSRERVRQLESEAKKKIRKFYLSQHLDVEKRLVEQVANIGGLVDLGFTHQVFDSVEDNHKKLLALIFDSSDQLGKIKHNKFIKNGWIIKKTGIKKIEKKLLELEELISAEKSVLTFDRLAKIIANHEDNNINLRDLLVVSANIVIAKGDLVGLAADRRVKPKNMLDKILFIMNAKKEPLHFSEIAGHILESKFDNKKINKSTIHNELIANKNFVLIGRGIYALKSWGYKEGTINDLTYNFLINSKSPEKLKTIMDFVNGQRQVKRNTVTVSLNKNSKIAKNQAGEYYIK